MRDTVTLRINFAGLNVTVSFRQRPVCLTSHSSWFVHASNKLDAWQSPA